ncbi:ABC transporter permease [candidate division KSB1 bacterium]
MNRKLPKINELLIRLITRPGIHSSIIGDIEEEYNKRLQSGSRIRTFLWCWMQAFAPLPALLRSNVIWSVIMFSHYVKTALRYLKRHKGYSLINILGLTAGITGCIFIMLYIQFEMSYDDYHEDVERIYRIANEQVAATGTRFYSGMHPQMGPVLLENFQQIETVARLGKNDPVPVKRGDVINYEAGLVSADPEVFDIFKVQFLAGNPADALRRPETAVLSRRIAQRYFGSENPVGQTITIDTYEYEVTAVIEDSPPNTHYKFEILRSPEHVYHEMQELVRTWNTYVHAAHTYVKLAPGTDIREFEKQMNLLAYQHLKEELEQHNYTHNYFLQPVRGIHLFSNFRLEAESPGSPGLLYLLAGTGILILLISSMNYVNLSTARLANRSFEVGIRKIIGARKRQLIVQYLGESLLLTFLALLAALLLTVAAIPYFNSFFGTNFAADQILKTGFLAGILVLILLIAFAAGMYPAFFLSAFRALSILKGAGGVASTRAVLRKVLVVGQFLLAIVMIIVTLVIFRQIDYMKNSGLGFDKENKLVIAFPRGSMLLTNYESVKQELLRNPSITGATAASSVPGREMFYWRTWPTGKMAEASQGVYFMNVDYDYISEFGLTMAAGRPFDRKFAGDGYDNGMILNEAAVKVYGWNSPEEALGKLMRDEAIPVVGVVKDFHFKGLQTQIEPLGMSIWPDHFRCITLTVRPENIDKTVSFIESTYNKLFPGEIFTYFFLDDDFTRHYRTEEQISRLFSVFTFFGIFIAGLGLFGLASYVADRRKREIGIRKVLGAPVPGIVLLLAWEFIKWVGIATIIAWPAAYAVSYSLLQNFAYRIDPGVMSFLGAAAIALAIAVLTVSIQTIRAAGANPVDVLRSE